MQKPSVTGFPFVVVLCVLGLFVATACTPVVLPPIEAVEGVANQNSEITFAQVRPIFESRCMACHSCMESPCQLNMQSFDGLRRGLFRGNVYDGSRAEAVAPTRLYEDAHTEAQWREKGFLSAVDGGDDSLLMSTLRLANLDRVRPSKSVRESFECPKNQAELRSIGRRLAMPYGLPALPKEEQRLLSAWVSGGARDGDGQKRMSTVLGIGDFQPVLQKQIRAWEEFLNGRDLKSRLVARYLYEHFFMAHFYFDERPRDFLRLVRSQKRCSQGLEPIATRRPNDPPRVSEWFYCFYREPMTVAYKNHIPYPLSAGKLKWLKSNFFSSPWQATRFPSFDFGSAANPLATYAEIPVEARYRFLLENAAYQVMTFIKGPVCNGSFAVNSIQEQFYVFFVDPKRDLMVRNSEFARKMAKELVLPGEFGENPDVRKVAGLYYDIVKNRLQARQNLNAEFARVYPKGLPLDFIWDGNGVNDNAVLTVFRHDDNAKVLKGARGDLSKTVFVLDYSTFERLVYNLAVNFDVYGNVAHQLLSRLYMDILRMDAEDVFLQMLPSEQRLVIKQQWYQGLPTRLKLSLFDENRFAAIPAGIAFASNQDVKARLVREILFSRLNSKVRGLEDRINWKKLQPIATLQSEGLLDSLESRLRSISSVLASKKGFARFFPEVSLLIVRQRGKMSSAYTLIRNREHENISWIAIEDERLLSEEDSLTILKGVGGAYPNQFFLIEEADAAAFVRAVQAVESDGDYKKLVRAYGVDRMSADIWPAYDFANRYLLDLEPVEAGVLDLSRYAQ